MPRTGFRAAVAAAIILLTSVVLPTVHVDAADAPPASSSHFVAVPKVRVMDSRVVDATKWKKYTANRYRLFLGAQASALGPGVLKAGSTVALQITTWKPSGPGYVTAYAAGLTAPAGLRHVVVTGANQSTTALVLVRIQSLTSVDLLFTGMTSNVTVDFVGVYAPISDPGGSTSGRFVPLAGNRRPINNVTAPVGGAGLSADLTPFGVPADATAALVLVTTHRAPKGYWVTYADGQRRPATIDLMLDNPGQSRSNLALVPLDGDAVVRLWAQAGGAVTLNVLGYFTGASAPLDTTGLFVPAATPLRVASSLAAALPAINRYTVEFARGSGAPTFPTNAVAGNLYTTAAWDVTSVVSRPAGLNAAAAMPAARVATPRGTLSTPFVAQLSSRGGSIIVDKGAHLVLDVVGWYLGTPTTAVDARPSNFFMRATPAGTLRWKDSAGTHISRIEAAKTNTTYATTVIADKGIVVGFNGMTTLGKAGNTMLFAHRTTHGGIFRYINTIALGATFSIKGADGRWYNYRVVNKGVTTPYFSNVQRLAAPYPPITAQLVACSRPDGTPTSTAYRIVVTGMLVSVTAQ